MKNLIILCAGLLILSACSIFRSSKTVKDKYERDSLNTTSLKSKTDIVTNTSSIDTGYTLTKETSDSTFYSPGVKASGSYLIRPEQLLRELSTKFFVLDTAMLQVSVHYDTLTNTLNLMADKKPEAGNVHKEKATLTKNGKSEQNSEKKKTEATENKTVKVQEKKESSISEKKPDYSWIWWLAGIIGVILLILLVYKRFSLKGFLDKVLKIFTFNS